MVDRDLLLHVLEGLRLVPAVLLVLVVVLAFYRTPAASSDHGAITEVVVRVVRPRTAAIVAFTAIAAATYFLDGAVIVVNAVLTHVWEGHTEEWHYLDYADVTGLIAFAGLLVVGSLKEVAGIDVWSRTATRLFVVLAILADATQVVLIALTAALQPTPNRTRHIVMNSCLFALNAFLPAADAPHVPEQPTDYHITNILHLATVATRLLVLIPLFGVLVSPRVSYVNTHASHASEDNHASSTAFLLPPSPTQSANYGTFSRSHQHSPSGTATPALSDAGLPQDGVRKGPMKPTPKKEVELEPVSCTTLHSSMSSQNAMLQTWTEIARRLKRILPYLWPSKSIFLQFLVVLCILLVVVGRIINLLIPFSLGIIVSRLESWRSGGESAWVPIIAYSALRWGLSATSALQEYLWQPVMQYSDRGECQLACMTHNLTSSLKRWHSYPLTTS